MAGDWLKIDHDTPDKPEVLMLAHKLGIHPDEALGKCLRFWRWFDKHTVDGNAHCVTPALLDAQLGAPGLSGALISVGWLKAEGDTMSLPNFSRHNGQTCKARALTAKRVAKHRNDGDVTNVTLAPLPREEKRREDRREEQTSGVPDVSAELFHNSAVQVKPRAPPKNDAIDQNDKEVLFYPCSGINDTWILYQSWIDKHAELFPVVDILSECKSALAWVDANPKKKKTYAGMARFLVAWISRAQNRGGPRPMPSPMPIQNSAIFPSRLEGVEDRVRDAMNRQTGGSP